MNYCLLIVFTLSLLFSLLGFMRETAFARQTVITMSETEKPLFLFDIYDKGEEFGKERWQTKGQASTWTLGPGQLRALEYASGYWSALLGGLPRNTAPVSITVGTYDEENADAGSLYRNRLTELTDAILNNRPSTDGSTTQIRIGTLTSKPLEDYMGPFTILPNNGYAANLTSTLVHEIGHAMGMISNGDTEEKTGSYKFSTNLVPWDNQLVDSFGTPSRPEMPILQGTASQPGLFVIDSTGYEDDIGGQAFFQGPNAMEVIGGPHTVLLNERNYHAVPGIPIHGFEENENERDEPDLSHIELRNSMMSHQNYRNWNSFMEAELAILQDIGIPLDRKNFYGASLYTDNGVHTLNLGFYGRNPEGTAYLPGTYNKAPFAIGLHLYGTNNTILATGEVLSAGHGSIGARIDGWQNRLTFSPDTRLHAEGENATGLLVAYGKEHVVIHRGEIRAANSGGIGARFDFGGNLIGNAEEYRGSYIRTVQKQNNDLLPELEGPLVSRFDVTGSLAGDKAAIFISENALVSAINIMRGAHLTGDIVSGWNPDSSLVQYRQRTAGSLTTGLTFGLLPDAYGAATATPDSAFAMAYAGNITGRQSIDVRLAGGSLAYKGIMDVRSFHADSGTRLLVPVASGTPVVIRADTVAFDAGSVIGVVSDIPFTYGDRLPDVYPIVRLEGGSIANNATLQPGHGSFMRGFYDYSYALRWEDGPAPALTAGIAAELSQERTAKSAITAPHAILLQHPYASLLHDHAAEVFAHGKRGDKEVMGESTEVEERFRLWVTPEYTDSRRHGSGNYTVRTPGVAFGADAWLNDRLFLGLGAYLSKSFYRSSDADVDAETVVGLLYGGARLPWGLELDAFAALGHTRYDQDRDVLHERYSEEYSGDTYGWGVSLARPFALTQSITARPFTSYEFLRNRVNGYDEGTGGEFGLRVGKNTMDLHRVQAGSEVVWAFDRGLVSATLFYSGVFGDRKGSADVAFTRDTSGFTLASKGWKADRHSLGAGLGLEYRLGEHARISGGYTFLGGATTQTHQAEIQLTIPF